MLDKKLDKKHEGNILSIYISYLKSVNILLFLNIPYKKYN